MSRAGARGRVTAAAATATATALAAIAVAPAPAGAAAPLPLRPPGAAGPLGTERLSDERTVTRWAHAAARAPVRARPSPAAPAVARLRWSTENGRPEVYLVLASRAVRPSAVWLRVRVPGRPNGRTGWVRREHLTALRLVDTQLLIDRAALTATLRRGGRVVWRSRVGIGAAGTPTPAGRFWVRERLRNLRGDSLYGPWAFGTAAYSALSDWPRGGVVGIHGTDRPELIPGRPSHGCVRVPNAAIVRLAALLPVGTPVRIR